MYVDFKNLKDFYKLYFFFNNKMSKYPAFFQNFYDYKDIYDAYHLENDQLEPDYTEFKAQEQINNSDLFLERFDQICSEPNSYTNYIDILLNIINNFNERYKNNNNPSSESVKFMTCSLSKFIQDFNENIFNDFKFFHGMNMDNLFSLIYSNYSENPFNELYIVFFKGLLNDLFLSQSIFKNSTIKYLAKGANGSVDLIKLKNNNNQDLSLIQKSVFKKDVELFDILRELIIGIQLSFYVSEYTPNFTNVFGMYSCYGSIPFDYRYSLEKYRDQNNCDSSNPEYICNFLKNYELFTLKDKDVEIPSIGNIDTNVSNVYLLTEFSKGIDVDKLLEKLINENDPNSGVIILNIMMQIIRSLIFAYQKIGYVHNDLHTQNIIVNELNEYVYLKEILLDDFDNQKTKYIAKIIDYGYSSIPNYVNYFAGIMSNETSNSNNDIFRIYTSILKRLNFFKRNKASAEIIRHLTIFIGAYYITDFRKINLETSQDELFDILEQYKQNDLINSYEYIPFSYNILTTKLNIPITAVYEYFVEQYFNLLSETNPLNLSKESPIDNYYTDKDNFYLDNLNLENQNIINILNKQVAYELNNVDKNNYIQNIEDLTFLYDFINKIDYKFIYDIMDSQQFYMELDIFVIILLNVKFLLRYYAFYTYLNNNSEIRLEIDHNDNVFKFVENINNIMTMFNDKLQDFSNDQSYVEKQQILNELYKFYNIKYDDQ